MLLAEALTLVTRMITTGEKHPDYKRTVELAETYHAYITGLDIDKKLKRFVPREDDTMFKQRCEITKAITPAISSSIRTPFNKVTRNNRVKTDLKLQNQQRLQAVQDMIKGFYGSPMKENRGLGYWMRTRFVELNFIDPNTWVVIEWDNPEDLATTVQPRPFEVCAKEAVNFYVANDVVKWLFIDQAITVPTVTKPDLPIGGTLSYNEKSNLPGVVKPENDTKMNPGDRFTFYDEDVTVVFEQVSKEYLNKIGYQLGKNQQYQSIKQIDYLVSWYTPNLGFAPVYRIGYKRDDATSARTFVNPWHDALCYFDKSLKTVSELDLVTTQHAFPQKLQYVQNCTGTDRLHRCNKGLLANGETCKACQGTGHRIVTTTQDAILLPMPDSKVDMVPLDAVLVYKSPSVDIIKWQNDYILQLEKQAHQAVFNSQVLIQSTATNVRGHNPVKTATEINTNMDSVYDALEPFTEKFSEIYKDFVLTFGVLTGETLENVTVVHEFPADFKMKGEALLLAERAEAAMGGAPAILLEAIDDDLAAVMFQGDDSAYNVYKTQRKYFPFGGMSPADIAVAITSSFVPKSDKVLYYNFSQIFTQIEEENLDFYEMTDLKKQRGIVDAMVQTFIDTVTKENPVITASTLRGPTPLGNAGSGGIPRTGQQPLDPGSIA